MRKLTLSLITAATLSFGGLWAQEPPQPQEQREPAQVQAEGSSETLQGILVDANCKASNPSGECAVSNGTTAFGMMTSDGKFVKFDSTGNALAESELKAAGKSGKVSVTVKGKVQGDTIEVQAVEVS